MNPKADTLLLAPVAAALAGWMLSGSPVPMALGVLVLVLALSGGLALARFRPGPVAAALPALLLCAAAGSLELWLFREGRALSTRADIPAAYHFGVALLWWATADRFLRPAEAPGDIAVWPARARAFGAVAGGLLLLAASASTVLYDFGPWEAHPVAALPLALWAGALFLPQWPFPKRFVFAAVPASLGLTALILTSLTTTDAVRPLFTERDESRLDLSAPRAPELEGNGPLGDGASRKIPREVNVRFRREIRVRVKAHTPSLYRTWTGSPLYLRSSTLALFESEEVLSPIRSGRWLYDLDDGAEDHLIVLDSTDPSADRPDPSRLHTYFIERKSANHLPLAENANALFTGSVYEFADDWYQLSPADEILRLRYTASAGSLPGEIQSRDLRAPRRAEIPAVFLQMPPSPLSARVRELCAAFPSGDPLGSIRAYLARQTRYSLHFTTPDDTSPLADFLFGSGHGHCEHYATATVLMLRSLGIPARVAYGYAGGITDAGQRLFAFRDSDFHAWAEVLTPDQRWKIFDTTPVVPGAAARRPAPTPMPPMTEAEFHDFSEFDPSTLRERNEFALLLADLVAWFSRHFFLATAAGLGLLGGLWRLLARRRGSGGPLRHSGEHDPGGRLHPPDFLVELARIAESLGLKRRPGQTWRELLTRLRDKSGLPPAAEEAVAYHYHFTYRGGRRDPAAEARYLEALRGWRETEGFGEEAN